MQDKHVRKQNHYFLSFHGSFFGAVKKIELGFHFISTFFFLQLFLLQKSGNVSNSLNFPVITGMNEIIKHFFSNVN